MKILPVRAKYFDADGRTDRTKLIVAILVINQRDVLISQTYFWNRTLRVSDRSSVHNQESSTVYTAIGKCHTEIKKWLKLLVYTYVCCS
jgi:hypothetical protein